ncbi:MAG TPA: DUF433 domain-containing protein [Thermoanaerobaculia bacterium]|nr:DUF433 domain-containing protein [Thermoanaerobaculia bacterium]
MPNRVIAIEIDPGLAARLRAKFGERLELRNEDATVGELPATPFRAVGNLPYNVGTPIGCSSRSDVVAVRRRIETEDVMDWQRHITADPNVCHGQACVAGTRILVSVVLDNLAAGTTEREILDSYPRLTPEAIQACIAYAADLAREEVVWLPA